MLDTDPSLNDVLKKAVTFVTTSETDRVLKGEAVEPTTHQMASAYKDKRSKSKVQQFNGKPTTDATGKPLKLKSRPQCFTQHDCKQCPHRNKQCNICYRTYKFSMYEIYKSKCKQYF